MRLGLIMKAGFCLGIAKPACLDVLPASIKAQRPLLVSEVAWHPLAELHPIRVSGILAPSFRPVEGGELAASRPCLQTSPQLGG